MKLLKQNLDSVFLEVPYDEIHMISASLGVPVHAFSAPDFEKKVGFPQSAIDEIEKRLWSIVTGKENFQEYYKLALQSGTEMKTRKYKTEVTLNKNDVLLLRNAFREASIFTKEHDDFHTMTGHNWSEAEELQKELDELVERT